MNAHTPISEDFSEIARFVNLDLRLNPLLNCVGCEREGCENYGVHRRSMSPYRSSTNQKLPKFHDLIFARIADPSPRYAICRYRFGRYLFEMPRRASRPAPPSEFGGRVGRLVVRSQPSLARRVRTAPAMVVRRPLFVGTTLLVSFPDHLAFSGPLGV
jgi:hypothetical protein